MTVNPDIRAHVQTSAGDLAPWKYVKQAPEHGVHTCEGAVDAVQVEPGWNVLPGAKLQASLSVCQRVSEYSRPLLHTEYIPRPPRDAWNGG